MKTIQYYSATELMERARDTMVPLNNQLEAQRIIASLISMHLARIQAIDSGADPSHIVTNSAFIQGSTGCGKSFIISSLCKCCGLGFESVDCTSITQAGYRGKNVGDAINQIAKNNPDFFKDGGILQLDEADKIFYSGCNDYHDVYSPQQDFLKLFEGGTYSYVSEGNQGKVNLDKVLIVLSGACSKIMPVLEKKYAPKALMGFSSSKVQAQEKPTDLGAKITLDDLVKYGLMPELASRIGSVIHIPDIDKGGYEALITDTAKTTVTNRFKTLFAMRGIKFRVSDKAVPRIAQICVERHVGARSIQAVFTENLTEAYNRCDDDTQVNQVILGVANGGSDLQVKFRNGERAEPPVFKKDQGLRDYVLRTELVSEIDINRFCHEFCKCEYLENAYDEALLYNFLQATCRFLGYECMERERRIANLIKLADASGIQGKDSDFKSPYDIIFDDYFRKLENLDKKVLHDTVSHYYEAFRSLAKDCNAPEILKKAITIASAHYQPRKPKCLGTRFTN